MNNERLKTEIKRHLAIAACMYLPRTLRVMAFDRVRELKAIQFARGA